MTYLEFHFVFTIPLFALMILMNLKNPLAFSKRGIGGALLLVFLAVTYTTPWDSYLIQNSVWTYAPENVIATLYFIPYEEYFFFIIQTIIGCLLMALLIKKLGGDQRLAMQVSWYNIAFFAIALLLLGGFYLAIPKQPEMLYMRLIFFWAAPIILLQWAAGGRTLLKLMDKLIVGMLLLTSYFWFADSVAISNEIWTFPEGTISGFKLFGILPAEEALFFVMTNLMVVQGYLLFTQVDFSRFQFGRA